MSGKNEVIKNYSEMSNNELAQAVHDKYITAAWVLHRKTCRLDARDFLEAVGYKKSFEYVNKKRFKVFS